MKPYPTYKDSGIEWIGKIPEGWNLIKVFYLFKAKKGSNASILTKEYCDKNQGDFPVYSGQTGNNGIMGNIKNFEFEYQNGITLSTTVGANAMSANYLKGKFSLSQNCMIIINRDEEIIPKYSYYFFQRLFNYERSKIPSHMQPSFRMEDLYNYKFCKPPTNEQTQIANFLDKKTAQIDSLIAKKENLIQLLEEEKTALINQAVTKGLDPNVKMKDSGIEWLGEIPEHWEVKRLRYLGKLQNGISAGAEFFGSGYPFLSYSDVYNNKVLPQNLKGLANSDLSQQNHFSVIENDIFFTRTSETIEEIGIASVCQSTIKNAVFAGFLIRFRPEKNTLSKEFSKYFFNSIIPRVFFVKEMNLVTRASLSQELLKRLPVLFPSLEEQIKIGNFLNTKTDSINNAKNKLKQEIELLIEYKTTLISEVVTGKVDVRDKIL